MVEFRKIRPKFSPEEDSRLVDLVEERPILWDTTREIYKRTELKAQIWLDVARNVGPAYSVDDVMTRFKSLKDTFMKNLRRVYVSKKSGMGVDELYHPRWNLFYRLMFLKKLCHQYSSTSNEQLSESADVDSKTKEYYDENFKDFVAILVDTAQPAGCDPLNTASVDSIHSTSSSIPSSASSCQPSKRPAETEVPDQLSSKRSSKRMLEDALGVLKDIASQQPRTTASVPADREEMLCSFIAERLRHMDREKKWECEDALMTTLMKFS